MKTSPLRAKRAALEELWQQGLSGNSLLSDQSRIADQFISDCLQDGGLGDLVESVALVALGGYGRQELFPYSDIDIMVLYREDISSEVGPVADAILYPLWDTGLEVGHGVRTIKESISHAKNDFFFRVAMIDARLISGSKSLFDELLGAYKEGFVDGKREEFVQTMQEFRDERRAKYGSHSYLLEPHIKEGKGGMRDIQAMMWTAKVVFGLSGLDGLASAGLLLEEESVEFEKSWNMLVKLRNRLHYISKRKNDQLYFEQQEDMADAFGYKVKDGVLGVEQFMRVVYGHLQNIAMMTDLFFDHVDEVLGVAGQNQFSHPDKVVEKGIEIRGNRLHLIAMHSDIKAKPHILIRLFLVAARTGVKIHHRTKRTVGMTLGLITDKVRKSTRMSNGFFSVLLEAKDVFQVLEVMLETGFLKAYIPEFEAIDTLAQHDLYHIYTVDRHSVQAVADLHEVYMAEDVARSCVTSVKILYLAALLHDIGKGSGKDHSEYGAELVLTIAKRLGLNDEESALLSFLVQYHLYIPENALRRDLEDAVFIRRCAEEIGGLERLAMLYLLSVADSKATGPSAWSEWKATLMLDMFLKVKSHFQQDGLVIADEGGLLEHVEVGAGWLRERVSGLLADEQGLRVDVSDLTSDYLSAFSPASIAKHVRLQRDNYNIVRQTSLVVAREMEEYWSLLIMSSDRPGLLAKICGVMALHNLNVINAQIFTWEDGTAVDVIDVRSTDGLVFAEKDWGELNKDLNRAIGRRLGLGHRLYQKMSSGYERYTELSGNKEPRIEIDNLSSDQYTVIEVFASDLPGQLYFITQTLADFGVNIHKAFIATEVEQLIDIFYVLDKEGQKIVDKSFQKEIEGGLLYSVSRLSKG